MLKFFKKNLRKFDLEFIPETWKGNMTGVNYVVGFNPYMKKHGYPNWDDEMPGDKVLVKWACKAKSFSYVCIW